MTRGDHHDEEPDRWGRGCGRAAVVSEVGAARRSGRAEAIRRLPGAYSLALRLRDAGLDDDLIAECLAVEPEALELLLAVAEAKLATILSGDSDK
jgi:hypothetical protein